MKKLRNKIIVILGPTASGKTKLAVSLAYKFNGEIVSADSRQVYKGMDVGTGKDLKDFRFQISDFRFQKIPYHLIDVVSPKTEFNLAKYQRLAYKAIDDILARKKLPIIVGGAGLYLQAVVDGYNLPAGKPDKKLRERLEKMSVEKLFIKLKKVDALKAEMLNESDRKNKRRLVRYIESTPRDVKKRQWTPKHEALLIGLKRPREVLNKRIYERLVERLKREALVEEVKRLHKQGVSWKRLEGFGLEYRYVALYLRGKLNYEEMVKLLNIAIRQFAKRQMSWFRRWERSGAKIYWIKSKSAAEKLIRIFLK